MEPYIGQIQQFAFGFTPIHWAQCNGQIISIASNTTLYALLGNIYGGDGRTTFALPDLRGRTPINYGSSPYAQKTTQIGERGGSQYSRLSLANLPPHDHEPIQNTLRAQIMTSTSTSNINESGEGENGLASGGQTPNMYTNGPNFLEYLHPNTAELSGSLQVNSAGQGREFSIQQPSLGLNYCIAINGIFPSRN